MLPAEARLTCPADYRAVLRARGAVRTGGPALALHLTTTDAPATRSPRVGLVVSRAVGNAVVRNRTKRRLRALLRERLARISALAPGSGVDLVVRAHPAAAALSSAELAEHIDRMLATAARRLGASA